MLPQEILNLRLSNQILLGQKFKSPTDVVTHMCSMQAQDYLGSLWAVALRTENSGEKDIEKAIANKTIVRTWPMRGTLNYVDPIDIRWMLKLMATRILKGQIKRFKREFDLDETQLNHCGDILIGALQGGKQLARSDVYRVLEEGGISAKGQRGLHIIWYLAQKGLLCFGPRAGKQFSFVLLDEWIPKSKELTHEEALAEIAYRYFNSRGPATFNDFIWWTGLTTSEARTAIELVKSRLQSFTVEDKIYWMSPDKKIVEFPDNEYCLLPPFDEYLISYSDRSLMLGNYTLEDVVPFSNGMFLPVIVENGLVIGTWKRTVQKNKISFEYKPFSSFNKKQEKEILALVKKYERFLRY